MIIEQLHAYFPPKQNVKKSEHFPFIIPERYWLSKSNINWNNNVILHILYLKIQSLFKPRIKVMFVV